MAGKVQGLTVVIDGDVTRLSKAMREAKAQSTVLKSHLRDMTKLLDFSPSSIDLVTRKQDILSAAITQTNARLEMLKKAHAEYAAMTGPLSKAEQREWQAVQREITRTELRYEELKKEAIEFGAAASASTLAAQGKMKDLAESLRVASYVALATGASVAFIGYQAVTAALDFESSFAGVKKTIKATDYELQQLAESTRKMALEKPVDVNDINYIMELGGQLGIATEHLEVFASTIADLDVATNLDLENASLKLSQFANIANMSQEDFDRLGSTITALGNNSATTETMIVNMAMRIAGAASNIGMSVPEVLALATSLASVGIQAEMGGNAISTIMNRIDRDVALSSETLQVWASTAGMSASEFAEAWETDVMNALLAVINGMGTFRDEGGNLNTLLKDMEISYMRQVDTMQRLSRTGELVTSTVNIANMAWAENTALTIEATARYDTAESKLQLMKNALNECGIVIGQEILPHFKDIVVSTTSMIRAFADMDDETKSLVINLGGFALGASAAVIAARGIVSAGSVLVGTYGKLKTSLAFYTAAQIASTTATVVDTEAVKANSATKSFATVATEALAVASAKLTTALTLQGAVLSLVTFGWAALAAAGIGLTALAIAKAIDGTEKLTKASKDQTEEVWKAEKAYREIAAAEGEHSEAAIKARAAFEAEQIELEASSETLKEFCDRMQDTIDSHYSLIDSMREATYQAESQAGSILNIADRIAELSAVQDADAGRKAELAVLTKQLNDSCGDLNLTYDATNDILSMTVDEMRRLADAESARLRSDAAMKNYAQSLQDQMAIDAALAQAEEELRIETEKNIKTWGKLGPVQVVTTQAQIDLENRVKSLTEAQADAEAQTKANLAILTSLESRQLALTYATSDFSSGIMSASEAAKYYSEMFGVAITETDVLTQHEADLASQARKVAEEVQAIAGEINELMVENDVFSQVLIDSGYSSEELAQKLHDAGISVDDLSDKLEQYSEQTANAFERIEQESGISLDTMISTLEHNVEVTKSWKEDMALLYSQAGDNATRNFLDYMASLGPEYATVVEAMVNDPTRLQKLVDLFAQAGEESVESALLGLGVLPDEINSLTDEVVKETEGPASAGGDYLGDCFATGYAEGIKSKYGYVADIAYDMAVEAAMAAARGQQSQSPSKVTRQLGNYFGEGYALGIEDEYGYVSGASKGMVDAAVGNIDGGFYSTALANIGGSGHVPSFMMNPTSGSSTYVTETHNHYSVGNIDYTGDAQVERAVVNLFDALERRANT